MLKESELLEEENKKIVFEYQLMANAVKEHKRYHKLLLETREKIREQRHDLRHQLAVIKGFIDDGTIDKASEYLNILNAQIPSEPKTFCDNMAVNAIVGYYELIAKESDINIDIQICVNEHYDKINDSNMCVIFGNILENAIEACNRMNDGEKFIKLKNLTHNGMLIITQDNSFDGKANQISDKFMSSKRADFGIGLGSVTSIAQKHGGNTTFSFKDNVFSSSIYVKI